MPYLRDVDTNEKRDEAVPEQRVRFDTLNLHPDIEDGLEAMGFEEATPIQGQSIPHALKKKDILALPRQEPA